MGSCSGSVFLVGDDRGVLRPGDAEDGAAARRCCACSPPLFETTAAALALAVLWLLLPLSAAAAQEKHIANVLVPAAASLVLLNVCGSFAFVRLAVVWYDYGFSSAAAEAEGRWGKN